MQTIGITEARARLAELTTRVQHSGEPIVIERHGRPAVAIVSIADLEELREANLRNAADARYAALDQARAVRARIRAERCGRLLPDSSETIRALREERSRCTTSLS